ncbi:MAG: hypothetical protein LBF59_00965 [Prevotellaceae bacterium]|nr:hypothetical protein [Prevotellaceae bacterium]
MKNNRLIGVGDYSSADLKEAANIFLSKISSRSLTRRFLTLLEVSRSLTRRFLTLPEVSRSLTRRFLTLPEVSRSVATAFLLCRKVI